MKNVFYINCFADPWVKVAEKLKNQYGFEPVYWVGYDDDDSSDIIPDHFPCIIYHEYYDAWKCKFPEIISERACEESIDIDFLRLFASEELQAIKMMDRMDYDRKSFNFMERQRHFRNLVRNWMAAIDLFNPEMVIAPVIPHRVYDYVLYQVCKWIRIPYIVFYDSQIYGRYIVLDDLFSINNMFKEKAEELYKTTIVKELIADDVIATYNRASLTDYKKAQPTAEAQLIKRASKNKGLSYLMKKLMYKVFQNRGGFYGKDGAMIKGFNNYYKAPNRGVDERYPFLKFAFKKWQSQQYNKMMSEYYESLAGEPVDGEKFVVYFLHYQPEATTSPGANIFVDQQLCVDTLLKNLPDDYMVYVKEHPQQYISLYEGFTSRMKVFYDDLAKTKRVRLITTKVTSFELFKNAKAVSTCLGTVAWEAMLHKIPAIIFGISWYENYQGVLRIITDDDAKKIQSFIENFQFDEQALLAYLAAFSQLTKRAYYYRAMWKNELNITEEECVSNITESIVSKYNELLEHA